MIIQRLVGSMEGYWKAEQNGYAAYGQKEKEAVELLKHLLRRKK